MAVSLVILVGGTLLAWAGVLLFGDDGAKTAATLALAITLPPAVMTLLAVVKVSRWSAKAGPTSVLAGTFFRMVMAVGAVALLRERATEFGTTATALAQWTTAFYLLTLVLETGLLWGLLSGADRKPEVRADEPPADEFRG